jgi:hypothetical protein
MENTFGASYKLYGAPSSNFPSANPMKIVTHLFARDELHSVSFY